MADIENMLNVLRAREKEESGLTEFAKMVNEFLNEMARKRRARKPKDPTPLTGLRRRKGW